MLFDPSNHDLIQALGYWLRGNNVRYQFEFNDNDRIIGLGIYDDDQNMVEHFSPGEWVTV